MRIALVIGLVSLAACDIASRNKKLPAMPGPATAGTQPIDPTAWTDNGDAACPSVDTHQPTPGGPPGTSVQHGRITRDPATGRLACQVAGHDHGPATEPDSTTGGTATGNYRFSKRSGEWVGRYADNRLAWTGEYVDGAASGLWTRWSPRGAYVSTGVLSDDKPEGMWLYWDRDAAPGVPPDTWKLSTERGVLSGVVVDGEPVITNPVCILGLAAPRCDLILSSGITFRGGPKAGNSEVDDNLSSLVFDADVIANVGELHGFGIGGGIYVGDEYARTGLRLSYRYWLAHFLAAEVAGGLLFPRGDLAARGDRGQSARLALNVADQIAFGVELERYDDDLDGEQLTLHATLRVGVVPLLTIAYLALRVAGGK
jgi:hypothetical protein